MAAILMTQLPGERSSLAPKLNLSSCDPETFDLQNPHPGFSVSQYTCSCVFSLYITVHIR